MVARFYEAPRTCAMGLGRYSSVPPRLQVAPAVLRSGSLHALCAGVPIGALDANDFTRTDASTGGVLSARWTKLINWVHLTSNRRGGLAVALIQCPECKQSVSDLAPTCPNCGRPIAAPPAIWPAAPPPARKTSCLTMGCAVLAGLFLLAFIATLITGGSSSRSSSGSATSAPFSPAEPQQPVATPTDGLQWSYRRREDPMAKGTIYEASVESSNTVSFDFPYQGEQRGTLTLRTHPRYGKDVIFSIERGQLPCPSYDGCTVLVRFDDGSSVRYSAAGPEDNSSETLFIRDYSGFVTRMLKARKVRISPTVYQEGAPAFEFDVANFQQDRYRPKK